MNLLKKCCFHYGKYQAKLWAAVDRWFLCKNFVQWLTTNGYDWITKCKMNTALFQLWAPIGMANQDICLLIPESCSPRCKLSERTGKAEEIASVRIPPNIYIKVPEMRPNKKGIMVKKQIYTPISAIATIRQIEDMDD